MAVILGLQLERRGLRPAQIGLVVSIGLLTASLYGLPAAALVARFGRRRVLAGAGLLMAVSGFDLALATQTWQLVLAGATGMLGASSVDLGPFLALEQSTLTEAVPAARRNRAFGRYSLTGGLAAAAGGLAAALATSPAAAQLLLLIYGAVGLITAGLALLLSDQVESPVPGPALSRAGARPLAGLAALFAVDSLGGGFVVQAVIAYWLHVRFGAGSGVLGPALAAIALVQTAAYGLPFVLAGLIKIGYDLALYAAYSQRPAETETGPRR